MEQRIRVEITGKDAFWERAFHVEWEDQFPERKLSVDGAGGFQARSEWLADLASIAKQTFCSVALAPENPRRREWMFSIITGRNGS